MHACSDELFVIIGLGQYPNLGVTDAFITVSIGTEQHTVRASRELGSDRLDTTVGPLGVEVIEGLKTLRVTCAPNEWGIEADLTFTGTVEALEEPRTFSRVYGRVQQDVTRYAQVGCWEGRLDGRRTDVRGHPRPVEGRARPVVGRAPGRRARGTRASRPARRRRVTASATTGCRCSSTTTCSRSRSTQDADGHRHVEESMRVWNLELGRPIEHLGRPEIDSTYLPGTREMRRRDGRDHRRRRHARSW